MCRSSRIRAPDKRGTYKYKCEKCDFKWKKKNSMGGAGFCSQCNSGIPIYPYKFKPDVSVLYNFHTDFILLELTLRLQGECLESLPVQYVTVLGKVEMPGRDASSSVRTVTLGTCQWSYGHFDRLPATCLIASRNLIRRKSVSDARSSGTTAAMLQLPVWQMKKTRVSYRLVTAVS